MEQKYLPLLLLAVVLSIALVAMINNRFNRQEGGKLKRVRAPSPRLGAPTPNTLRDLTFAQRRTCPTGESPPEFLVINWKDKYLGGLGHTYALASYALTMAARYGLQPVWRPENAQGVDSNHGIRVADFARFTGLDRLPTPRQLPPGTVRIEIPCSNETDCRNYVNPVARLQTSPIDFVATTEWIEAQRDRYPCRPRAFELVHSIGYPYELLCSGIYAPGLDLVRYLWRHGAGYAIPEQYSDGSLHIAAHVRLSDGMKHPTPRQFATLVNTAVEVALRLSGKRVALQVHSDGPVEELQVLCCVVVCCVVLCCVVLCCVVLCCVVVWCVVLCCVVLCCVVLCCVVLCCVVLCCVVLCCVVLCCVVLCCAVVCSGVGAPHREAAPAQVHDGQQQLQHLLLRRVPPPCVCARPADVPEQPVPVCGAAGAGGRGLPHGPEGLHVARGDLPGGGGRAGAPERHAAL